jgi:hypothetical protein
MTFTPVASVTVTWIRAFWPYRGLQSASGAVTVTFSPAFALDGFTE